MKEPKDFYNDPQFTAYALGELEGDERAVIEAALETDAAARAAVDEIRATARQIEAALAAEPEMEIISPPLKTKHVAPYAPARKLVRFPYWAVAGLAAACFAVMLALHESEVVRVEEHRKAVIAAIEIERATEFRKSAAVVAEAQSSPHNYTEVSLSPPAARNEAAKTAAIEGAIASKQTADEFKVADGTVVADNNSKPQAVAVEKTAVATGPYAPNQPAKEEVIVLQPFGVSTEKDTGFQANETLAGARTRTKTKDSPSSVGGHTGGYGQRYFAPLPYKTSGDFNTEAYGYHADSDFVSAAQNPLSTFALDVDTASYANVRRFLQAGGIPPADAVRVEELVNYFPYAYAAPRDNAPLAATLEVAAAPWAPTHRLVRIGLKAREVTAVTRPAANLVFLIDVSGSMDEPDKLPLLQQSMRLLLDQLRPDDRVAIVTYAGESSLALPSTPASHRREILEVLNALHAEGSTNGGRGLELAYDIAKANFITGGTNRVILSTDGDFNVGVTSEGGLVRLVEEKARSGVALTALGFGTGNYKDAMFKQLADKGHGNYGYIDTLDEAKKLLVEQVVGTLVTVAKDVKVQVEFNPARVQSYRLMGYDDRALKKEDFNNDAVTAGDVGAGHTVTALYEIVPAGLEPPATPDVDALKYQKVVVEGQQPEAGGQSAELLTVKVRYTPPEGGASQRLEFPLTDRGAAFTEASMDFKFAAAVAGFGMILRDSPHKGSATLSEVEQWAGQGLGTDAGGYRTEFIGLVHQAEKLKE